jgi:hypothetical protein
VSDTIGDYWRDTRGPADRLKFRCCNERCRREIMAAAVWPKICRKCGWLMDAKNPKYKIYKNGEFPRGPRI